MTPSMWIASVAFVLLWLGYSQRHNRLRHVACIAAALALDIGLVLYLEATRSAIKTALSFELAILQQIHIAVSTVALLLYFPIIFLGIRLLMNKASRSQRNWHRQLAVCALLFRTLGFVFMFSMLGKHG